MNNCFFISDIHGNTEKFTKLFDYILIEKPDTIFIGGDILPSAKKCNPHNFLYDFLFKKLHEAKAILKQNFPQIFIIMGNDDARNYEPDISEGERYGLWKYIQNKIISHKGYKIIGYSFIPPTPFLLKDWEKYDVSRYVDPGCLHPFEGKRTITPDYDIEYSTIENDLKALSENIDFSKTVYLFHTPPYQTKLDRAALDGKTFEHVPLDVHVGSIAVKRFIEEKQPLLTLHGHIHESSSITGSWHDSIENTVMFNAAYEKNELSVIRFDINKLEKSQRMLF